MQQYLDMSVQLFRRVLTFTVVGITAGFIHIHNNSNNKGSILSSLPFRSIRNKQEVTVMNAGLLDMFQNTGKILSLLLLLLFCILTYFLLYCSICSYQCAYYFIHYY